MSIAPLLLCALAQASSDFPLSEPDVYVTDVAASEDVNSASQAALRATLVRGVEARDRIHAARAFAPGFLAAFPSRDAGHRVADDLLEVREYHADPGAEPLDTEAFLDALFQHVDGWVDVERTLWKNYVFLLDPNGQRAHARVHFEVGGTLPGGGRSELQLDLAVRYDLADSWDGDGTWTLGRLELLEGRLVGAPVVAFQDITAQAGFTFIDSADERELFLTLVDNRRVLTVGGLTAIDWNADGFPTCSRRSASTTRCCSRTTGTAGSRGSSCRWTCRARAPTRSCGSTSTATAARSS